MKWNPVLNMYALYRAIDINVGRPPPQDKMSSTIPNRLWVPKLARFSPLRPWAPWVRGNKNCWLTNLVDLIKGPIPSSHIIYLLSSYKLMNIYIYMYVFKSELAGDFLPILERKTYIYVYIYIPFLKDFWRFVFKYLGYTLVKTCFFNLAYMCY